MSDKVPITNKARWEQTISKIAAEITEEDIVKLKLDKSSDTYPMNVCALQYRNLDVAEKITSIKGVNLDTDIVEGWNSWDDCGHHVDAGSIHGMVCPEPCEFGRQCEGALLPRPATYADFKPESKVVPVKEAVHNGQV